MVELSAGSNMTGRLSRVIQGGCSSLLHWRVLSSARLVEVPISCLGNTRPQHALQEVEDGVRCRPVHVHLGKHRERDVVPEQPRSLLLTTMRLKLCHSPQMHFPHQVLSFVPANTHLVYGKQQ